MDYRDALTTAALFVIFGFAYWGIACLVDAWWGPERVEKEALRLTLRRNMNLLIEAMSEVEDSVSLKSMQDAYAMTTDRYRQL